MIKRSRFIAYTLTGIVCFIVCGGVFAVWAASPEAASVFTDPRAIYSGTSETSVALMFNVYSGEEYIPDIMDTLAEHDASATFFIGGCWAEKNESLTAEIAGRFEIGSHGYLHRDHSAMGIEGNLEEMRTAHRLIADISGVNVGLFAPPSGAYSEATLDAAEEMGYITVLWSKDTIDWRDQDPAVIEDRATENLKCGDMILMHPTAATAKALPTILERIGQAGLGASCVSEVL